MADTVSFDFTLDVVNDWPPMAVERLPFRPSRAGYELLAAPLFLPGLSVGDVLAIDAGAAGAVESWSHRQRSGRSTLWILRLATPSGIQRVLRRARDLGCETVSGTSGGIQAIDVPADVSLTLIGRELERLNPRASAVTWSSLRHPDRPAGDATRPA